VASQCGVKAKERTTAGKGETREAKTMLSWKVNCRKNIKTVRDPSVGLRGEKNRDSKTDGNMAVGGEGGAAPLWQENGGYRSGWTST